MMIQYCPHCPGRPYARGITPLTCPVCGLPLEMENTAEASLAGRPMLPLPEGEAAGSGAFRQSPPPARAGQLPPEPAVSAPTAVLPARRNRARRGNRSVETALGTVIQGRVAQYSSSGREDGNYRRLLVTRLTDAMFYGQRFEDVLHRFTVRVPGGTDALGNQEVFDVPVNVHGTISGGPQLADNSEVEVTGRYRRGVLMARRVRVISNGYQTPVRFQHAFGLIALAALTLLLALYLIANPANSAAILGAGILGFLKTWAVLFAALLALFLLFAFSRFGFRLLLVFGPRRHSPLAVILLSSLLLTILIAIKFGTMSNLLSALSALGMALLPTVLTVVLLLYLLFRLFFPEGKE